MVARLRWHGAAPAGANSIQGKPLEVYEHFLEISLERAAMAYECLLIQEAVYHKMLGLARGEFRLTSLAELGYERR